MKYIDEYRNKDLVLKLADIIKQKSRKNISLMEVCGGHTMAIHKFGLPSLLPANIRLISGPGCPVCVTAKSFIDKAVAYSRIKEIIITTFGDLIRVPGSSSSLEKEKAAGNDVRIVYSSLEALEIAKQNKNKKIIFLGIGFETTAPTTACAVKNAKEEKTDNFFVLSSHKIMPPAMAALIDEGIKINGYICPGHVSAITGSKIYNGIVEKYSLGCVVSGFEPVDILKSVLMLVLQIENNDYKVEIEYSRAVKEEGNVKAQEIMKNVFELKDDWWRGLGIIKGSGLSLNGEYYSHDIEKVMSIEVEETVEDKGCICGEILKGLKNPENCLLFNKSCNPSNPVGACMVSGEGACNAYYRFKNYE